MKALLLVLFLPLAEAAVTSSLTLTPAVATVGQSVFVTYTKTASLSDGLQNGTVTLRVTGPVNATLASRAYHFTATLYAALSWTWTPPEPGNYTLTFTDQSNSGTASNQSRTYHVEDAGGGGAVETHSNAWPGFPLAAVLVVAVVALLWPTENGPARIARIAVAVLLVLALAFLVCRSVAA
ncbi:MAG: hypothetical protein LC623_02270 [Halobacteriales archaeon]|nr:hypothetical protein [Halobacteriales archaeon]